MAKRKFEEILEDLKREVDDEELISELEAFGGSSLRKQAEQVPELERKLAEAEAKVEKLEAAPKRTEAFKEYGIDLENLSKAEAAILDRYEGELDEEAIGALAEEFDLPVVEKGGDDGEEEESGARQQTRQALSGKVSGSKLTISPEDYANAPIDKRMKFLQNHPDEAEALMHGESVTGVTL